MKRPLSCLVRFCDHCEECAHWQPIPFHQDGGECLYEFGIEEMDRFRKIFSGEELHRGLANSLAI